MLSRNKPGLRRMMRNPVIGPCCGFGPIGQTVSRLLKEGGIIPVVIETNIETTRCVRDEGLHNGIRQCGTRRCSGGGGNFQRSGARAGPNNDQTAEIIRVARSMNSNLNVLARTNHLRDSVAMRTAGANEVFWAKGKVSR